jgi:hypothetical protein
VGRLRAQLSAPGLTVADVYVGRTPAGVAAAALHARVAAGAACHPFHMRYPAGPSDAAKAVAPLSGESYRDETLCEGGGGGRCWRGRGKDIAKPRPLRSLPPAAALCASTGPAPLLVQLLPLLLFLPLRLVSAWLGFVWILSLLDLGALVRGAYTRQSSHSPSPTPALTHPRAHGHTKKPAFRHC